MVKLLIVAAALAVMGIVIAVNANPYSAFAGWLGATLGTVLGTLSNPVYLGILAGTIGLIAWRALRRG